MLLPSRELQRDLITQVLEKAHVDPADIVYVEAHGTGTVQGDAVEAQAIDEAIGLHRQRSGKPAVLVGSIKTNVGHTESAAGLAGIIKSALILHHSLIPRSLHAERESLNDFFKKSTSVAVALVNTPLSNLTEKISVNSFGFGGTNGHAILGRPPHSSVDDNGSLPVGASLFVSSHSKSALQQSAKFAELLSSPHSQSAFAALTDSACNRRLHEEEKKWRLAALLKISAISIQLGKSWLMRQQQLSSYLATMKSCLSSVAVVLKVLLDSATY